MMSLQGHILALPTGSTLHAPGGSVRRAEALPRERLACVPTHDSARLADELPTEMPVADWGALLNAVTQRLQRLTDVAPGQPAGLDMLLRECVDALRQLNAELDDWLLDATALSTELAVTRAELAVTRAELARAQFGR